MSCHSLIERNNKRYLNSSPVYVPHQYATLVGTARKTGKLFKDHESDEGFWDLKDVTGKADVNFKLTKMGKS